MAAATPTRRRGQNLPMIIVLVFLVVFLGMIFTDRNPFNILLVNPLINLLILLNIVTLGQFGLTIILFTVILRVLTIPMTIRQLESTKAMQTVQPLVADLQKKYKDPKRRQEEMMKLYREHHINPLGCFFPFLIQIGTFVALNAALRHMVGGAPESLVGLAQRLYPIGLIRGEIPLNQHFLWMNLGQPDGSFAVPVLVALSTYIQQRLSVTPNANPQMQQQQQMLTWMLPLMMMFFTLNLPSGVGVYWVVSNVFSLIASYLVYGRRILTWKQLLPFPDPATQAPAPAVRPKAQAEKAQRADIDASDYEITDEPESEGSAPREARSQDGKRRGKRKKRR